MILQKLEKVSMIIYVLQGNNKPSKDEERYRL